MYLSSFIRNSTAVRANKSFSVVAGVFRRSKSSSVIGDMPMILRAALVMSDLVLSVFSYISCLMVFALVMFIMCSSAVDGPCSRLVSLLCMLSSLFSMLSTLFFTSVMLSVFCVIFCVSPDIDFLFVLCFQCCF